MEDFNIFAQLFKELDEFFRTKVHIAGSQSQENARYLMPQGSGYDFSQWETLNRIELYYNSKFESGETDSEGQQKLFLNICKFRALVAAKQTDLDTKDFVFIPEENASVWGAYFMNKRFRQWSKESFFAELINQVNADYSKYGTAVLKKVGSKLERVPLITLRNQQDAHCLKCATYVIEEHKDMTYEDMVKMKEWDVSQLDMKFGQKETVYERHGCVPLSFFKKQKKEEVLAGDEKRSIDCVTLLTLQADKAGKNHGGTILFIEKEEQEDRPYEEACWEKQDGRWLAVGEVENQFENQVARNMTTNQRRRALLWSSKRIFQSSDTELPKNLVRDVKDGDVLRIMPNGNVTQVDMATRNTAEFQSMEDVWERNSDQKSFTFEVATGEALPSGTPFRLGVVLSNSVNSHFALKRENLGLFFNRVIDNLVFPIFEKENSKAHTLNILADEEGSENLKEALIKLHTANEAKDQMLRGIWPDLQVIEAKVQEQIRDRRNIFMDIPQNFYKSLKTSTQLVITGEQVDIPKRLETLTTLRLSLVQEGNLEAAQRVLKQILALTGENHDALVGAKPQTLPAQNMMPQAQVPAQMPAQVPA